MAEAIKYAMIGCPKLIPLLKESQGRMEEIVAQCIKEKQRLVEEDEREMCIRDRPIPCPLASGEMAK